MPYDITNIMITVKYIFTYAFIVFNSMFREGGGIN